MVASHNEHVRVVVRVYPGASRSAVGGRYGDAQPPCLVVRVRERAMDGRANRAVLTEVARAFDVPRRHVRLLGGATSRTKTLEVTGAEQDRLAALLSATP